MDLGVEPGRAPSQPDRFRAARGLRGLTQAEVVRHLNPRISAAALSQIESGKSRPTAQTLHQLARVLDVPPGFFSMPWPGTTDGPAPAYFRDLRATSLRERRRATVLAVLLSDLLNVIERHVRLPEVTLPSYPMSQSAGAQEIEAAAAAVRSEWELGREPIPHVVRLLERHGVAVARLSLGHRMVDGFAVRFPRRPLVLLTDDKSNYVRLLSDRLDDRVSVVLREHLAA